MATLPPDHYNVTQKSTSAGWKHVCGRPRVKEPNALMLLVKSPLQFTVGKSAGFMADLPTLAMSDEFCIENAVGSRKYS